MRVATCGVALLCFLSAALAAERIELPNRPPVPAERPGVKVRPASRQQSPPVIHFEQGNRNDPAELPAFVPVPGVKPEVESDAKTASPTPKPVEERLSAGRKNDRNQPLVDLPPGAGELVLTPPAELGGPRKSGGMPAAEIACRSALKALGAEFEESEPASDPAGCRMDHPIELTRLTKDVEVGPGLLVNCQIAEAAAKFTVDTITNAAKAQFGSEVASITQASGYVCRPRNGTGKLSEHAFGNAWDIASFKLASGKVVEVKPAPTDTPEGKFLNAVRAAACGPFKTVLGPGSDADHEFHFHFDLAPRRNGGTYCK